MKRNKNQARKRGPFKLISSRKIYKNPWISVREDKVVRPDGKQGIFGIVETLPGVSIVAIDGKDYCYLAREYGYGHGKMSLGLAGGGVERGETPLQTAKRECAEELGLESSNWKHLGMVHFYKTILNIKEHLFLALDARPITGALPGYDERFYDEQFMEIVRMPFRKVVRMALDNKISAAEHITAILLADNFLRKQHGRKKSRN